MRVILRFGALLSVLFVMGCSSVPPEGPARATPAQVQQLAVAISNMGDNVDPAEAQRAAQIAYDYPLVLRKEYQVTDGPLIHNIKVNNGTRPRGLCYQWADDMQARLAQEDFQTLDLLRAIANSETRLLIDHSTVIIAAEGEAHEDGIVLDPWRHSGALYWSPTPEDERYTWVPRQEVFARRQARATRAAR